MTMLPPPNDAQSIFAAERLVRSSERGRCSGVETFGHHIFLRAVERSYNKGNVACHGAVLERIAAKRGFTEARLTSAYCELYEPIISLLRPPA